MSLITQEAIKKMVERQIGKRDVKSDDRLVEDLGAESADVANLVAAAEEAYGIMISESEIARIYTSTDLFDLVQTHLNES